ncbi:MAG: hypothetical protein WBP93_11410 [Pyrinomonadaceae bacterium]
MREPHDNIKDTDKPAPNAANEAEHPHGSYYYDDSTGYETYDPSKDDEDEAEENDE